MFIIMVVFNLPNGLASVLALGREICLFFHLSGHSSIFSNFLLVFPSIFFGPSSNSFRSLSMSVSIARLLVGRCLSGENVGEMMYNGRLSVDHTCYIHRRDFSRECLLE